MYTFHRSPALFTQQLAVVLERESLVGEVVGVIDVDDRVPVRSVSGSGL